MTECNEKQLEFHALGERAVIGKFDGGAISSDGGALLLSEVEAKAHIVDRLAGLFVDHRKPDLIEHSVRALIARGDMENRIKEQQLDLFADRTSTHTLYANQLRLYFSSLWLCPGICPVPAGVVRHRAGACQMRHHSHPVTEGRCAGARESAQGLDLVHRGLFARATFRSSPAQHSGAAYPYRFFLTRPRAGKENGFSPLQNS